MLGVEKVLSDCWENFNCNVDNIKIPVSDFYINICFKTLQKADNITCTLQ